MVAMQNKQSPERSGAAPSCYGERLAECKRLLRRIEAGLERHGVRQAATAENWTHAGNLGHVAEELANIVAFVGDAATTSQAATQELAR